MALTIDKLQPMRLNKTPILYPTTLTDKFKGSVVFVLGKDIDSVCDFISNNKFLVNQKKFISYYIERSFDYILNNMLSESEDIFSNTEVDKLQTQLESDHGQSDVLVNDYFSRIGNNIIYYPEAVEKIIFSEDYDVIQNYSNLFRKFLYSERIKNHKEMITIYKKIKTKLPFIKYTYLNLDLYKQKNLFMDWSYYFAAFEKNNIYKLDRGQDLMLHMMQKFINDSRLSEIGYTNKLVIIPVKNWASDIKDITDYGNKVTPLSMIYRLIKTGNNLSQYFGNTTFMICNDDTYFKLSFDDFDVSNLPRFNMYITKLLHNDTADVEFLVPNTKTAGNNDVYSASDGEVDDTDNEEEIEKALEKEQQKDAEWASSVVADTQAFQKKNVSNARLERMKKLNEEFDKTKVGNKTIKQISDSYYKKDEDLTIEPIPIDSLNEEWKNVKYPTFNSKYNVTDDIVMILKSLNNKSNPLSIISVNKEETSTYEDYVDTYTIKLEDIYGTRSEIMIDVPKLINNRFMKLRGNIKTINAQLLLLPIIKTSEDTAQIVTSYNKIFISRVSPANGTKITKGANKLYKALNKYKGTDIEVFEGDNSSISNKFELPAEYYALSSNISKVKIKGGSYITFDYEQANKLTEGKKIDSNKICVGYDGSAKKPLLVNKNNIGYEIGNFIAEKSKGFKEVYDGTKPSNKLSYAEASILNTKIPVIIVMAYSEGLQTAMDKAGVKYEFSEKRRALAEDESLIRFNDGYLIYNDADPKISILMSGLDQFDTADFSIKDINTRNMWLDALDSFGGRFKADGLDNFYDCMFDPMSIDICKRYNLPYDYVTALGYAAGLLADTKYNKHTDITGNRLRTNELIAGYIYKSITKAYGDYANKVKRTGKGTKFTFKQSAVVDNILLDPGCSDLSILNPLLEAEANNTVSFKGLSGMNSDRSYDLDKRIYNKSMLGVLGVSTGFAANMGITRQISVNSSIKDTRGIVQSKTPEELNTLNCLTVYEALAPYGTTHDDPVRTAMGFIQTTKHQMRVKHGTPNLITYGMDEALPYFTTDIFSYKFKGVKGKVLDVTEDRIIFQEIDKDGNKANHIVSLKETVMKNSDGGFFITVKLSPLVKKGDTLKYNDIIAYDKTAFSKAYASDRNQKNIAYNIGTMAKIAIMCTDEAYEDSSIINTRLSDALTTEYCVKKERSLPAQTNVYSILDVGTKLEEGTTLMVFESAFDEKDANDLLAKMADDELEMISDFGRIQLRSKMAGILQDIKIYRTCELEDLSPSLRKIVTKYENNIKKEKTIAKRFGISDSELKQYVEPDYKLPQTGKLKITENGVLIEFYIKTEDKMGIGDKLTYNTAIKGVIKDIIPEGEEPYTDFRPHEQIDALLTSASVNARMVASIINSGSLNKTIVELTRKCKDILGIKWDNLKND